MTRYLVTSALPYANGPIHLGHIAGAYLPGDIFVRYLRLGGEDVVYLCGTDEHGVPITISAEKEGVTPRAFVDRYHDKIKQAFARFSMSFDNFSRTSLPHHYELSQEFFLNLKNSGYIVEQEDPQQFCAQCSRFLPDRYVEGDCPNCGKGGARGDQCEACGRWLSPVALQNPVCKICGSRPEVRKTRHQFLDLGQFQKELEAWLETKKDWKDNVRAFVRGWFSEGLKPRAITRDISWGVPVPLPGEAGQGKVLYVWFDAPIGYISSTIEWARKIGKPDLWKEYWFGKDVKLVHFIGKDNIVFHCVTWPAMLIGQRKGYVMPADIPANEFLNLEGQKFSTSRNWCVWADEALDDFDADRLRYALAAMAPEAKDSDFTWKEFRTRVNTELADTAGNLASRVLKFVETYREGKLPGLDRIGVREYKLLTEVKERLQVLGNLYRTYQVRSATQELANIGRMGNRFFDETAPWKTRKDDARACDATLAACAWIVRAWAYGAWPIVPTASEKIWKMLGEERRLPEVRWDDLPDLPFPSNRKIGEVTAVFKKVTDEEVAAQEEKLKRKSQVAGGAAAAGAAADGAPVAPVKPEIDYDHFARLDIRIATIVKAEKVEKSKKLLRLEVDLGFEKRQVVAGIAETYAPEQIVGKQVPVLLNLKPAKLMGVESRGMILAGEFEGKPLLLHPEKATKNGAGIK